MDDKNSSKSRATEATASSSRAHQRDVEVLPVLCCIKIEVARIQDDRDIALETLEQERTSHGFLWEESPQDALLLADALDGLQKAYIGAGRSKGLDAGAQDLRPESSSALLGLERIEQGDEGGGVPNFLVSDGRKFVRLRRCPVPTRGVLLPRGQRCPPDQRPS